MKHNTVKPNTVKHNTVKETMAENGGLGEGQMTKKDGRLGTEESA